MTKFTAAVAMLSLFGFGLPACAQHIDVLVQAIDGKLETGNANYDNNTWLLGERVYGRQLLSNFRTNDPGFTTLETGHPLLDSSASGLSPNVDLSFDIVPSTINGQEANFWYWDGMDTDADGFELEDVSFDLGAPGLEWRVLDDGGTTHTADGTDTVVPDVLVQNSFSDGAVHSHIIMLVVDNDGNAELNRPEGVYLTSMVLQADGFEASDPFFFVHRTSGLTNEPRDIAVDWVRDNYDSLIGATQPGDFNGDGTIDGSDFLTWQRDLGTPEDLAAWQTNYGQAASSALSAAIAVPEPTAILLLLCGCGVLACHRSRR